MTTPSQPPAGPYSARYGAIHHTSSVGFLFTVSPPKHAETVARALNKAEAPTSLDPAGKQEREDVAAYNERFDAADAAGREVFEDALFIGYMHAKHGDGGWPDDLDEARDEFEADFESVARQEAWDAHRDAFFKHLPLAALSPAPAEGREGLQARVKELEAENAKAREALDALLPPILCGESWDLPDAETVEITTTFGALKAAREVRALLQQGDESKGPKTGEGTAQ